jgi:putative ATP-dependent endonuclease of OLD family
LRLSRIVIKNFRSLQAVDVKLTDPTTVVIGENNTGKSCFLHAIRLCLDVGLSSAARQLTKEDVHCGVDQNLPFQVLVGVEFTGFAGNENEEALLHGMEIAPNRARLFYRFRPKRIVREQLARAQLVRPLTLEDYGWELFGGGNPAWDLPLLEWHHENGDFNATDMRFQYLQAYLVHFLPALRDVEVDLAQSRRSPLMRLIEASDIGLPEQQALIDAVQATNQQIEASPTIRALADAIDGSLEQITGPAFQLDVELGLSSPTFQAIARNLIVLLSNSTLRQFEPRRNGLGFNNLLYIAILMEHFRKRAAAGKSAGELILIEEPEAHLHPQLQATLLAALRDLPFQVIVTTHSTQITAKVPLSSFLMLTQRTNAPPAATAPIAEPGLSEADRMDLERYLDATKSNLLFARKVMLVEGAAELLLIPVLAQRLLGLDLEREGITLVAVHGVHFGPFARMFSANCMPKRCAIVADADGPAIPPVEGDNLPE